MDMLNFRKVNIALIDDSKKNREIMSGWVNENEQCKIIFELENGLKVEEMIRKYRPDIMFLDDAMPIKSGFDVLKDLENLRDDCRPYIVMMSDLENDLISKVAINKGANDFIYKPVSKNTFLSRISMYCTCFNLEIKRKINDMEEISYKDYEKLRKITYELKEKKIKNHISSEVNKILLQSNFKASHQGLMHIVNAVEIIMLKYGADFTMSKHIYPEIADMFGVSEYSVEYDIRHAIVEAWKSTIVENKTKGTVFERYEKRPSNAELLKYIVSIIEMKQYGC